MAPTTKQQEVADMVTFMSYNSTGMSTVKCQWINEICEENNVDYLAIQEHFGLQQPDLQKLSNFTWIQNSRHNCSSTICFLSEN